MTNDTQEQDILMAKAKAQQKQTAKVFMSGASQAVRLPQEYRFDCDEVTIRREGRHIILSPRFENWDDHWANSTRPTDDFVETVLNRREYELPPEQRADFD